MALTWDLTKVADSEHLPYMKEGTDEAQYNGYREWPDAWKAESAKTEACVWASMFIGIGHWTAESMDEVVWRIRFWEKANGRLIVDETGPVEMPEEHIRALEGLRTNVPNEKRNAWLVRQWGDRKK